MLARLNRYEWLLVALFALIIAFQNFVAPTVGLANNGDFGKLVGRFSLGPEDLKNPDENAYFVQRWVYDPTYLWVSDNYSSELLLIRAALGIGRLFSPRVFDLRTLGAIHAIFWIACFAAALPLFRGLSGWTRYAVPLFAMFVFTDVSYVAYLNSFYTDAGAFLFLSWCIAVAFRMAAGHWTGWRPFLAFLVAALLFVFSKPQHSPLGLLLWLCATGLSLSLPALSGRFAGLMLAPMLALAVAIGVSLVPEGERQDELFSVIFAKLLPHSTDPAADLRELGLPPDFQQYTGRYAQQPGDNPLDDPGFRQLFSAPVHWRLAVFFLEHPFRSLTIIYEDLRDRAAVRRSLRLGNYLRKTGYPPYTLARSFGWWSALRSFLFRIAPWHIVAWYGLYTGGGLWFAWRHKGSSSGKIAAVGLLIGVLGLAALVLASLGDAGETDRHLWMFHVLTDMTLVVAASAAASGRRVASGTR